MRTLKHEQLAQVIRQMIVGGQYKPGDMLPSQNEMAREYGLNQATVREAVATLVNENLVIRIRGKGTFVKGKKNGRVTIGLTTHLFTDMGDDGELIRVSDINARIMQGVNMEAKERDASIMFALNSDKGDIERNNINDFIDQRVDAIILMYLCKERNIDMLRKVQEAGIELVLVDRTAEYLETDYVVSDNFGAARQATDTLLDRGYSNMLFFRTTENASSQREREAGFVSALHNHGIDLDDKIVELPMIASEGWHEAWESKARKALAKLRPPIGIFAYSSHAFLHLWPLIEELGLAHSQVGLAAFDTIAYFTAPEDVLFVNAVQQEEEIGRVAVQIALDKINGAQGFRQVRLSPRIVIRGNHGAVADPNGAEDYSSSRNAR